MLSRKPDPLRWVAQALREQGIDHIAPEDRALLDAPEARDVIAVLDALVSPGHDLSLAHALRCPLFGATDEELMVLSRQARPGGWWAALMQGEWSQEQPALRRAQQLLPRWRAAARQLPPHDWLDRIVAEGQWRERLAAAVADAHRATALAHLDAVLGQALALDGGRYATAYGVVRALKRQPLAVPPQPQPDAVQLLTVHGAKGLEARVVFIADADGAPPRPERCTVLVDWPVESPHPVSCAFLRNESAPPPSLRAAMQAELQARQREELNGLYVAMTRAREQLVFSRIEPHQKTETPSWWQRVAAAGAVEAEPWTPAGMPAPTVPGTVPEPAAAPHLVTVDVLPALSRPVRAPAGPAGQIDGRPAGGEGVAEAAVDQPPDAAAGRPQTSAADLGRAVHRVLERLTAHAAAWQGGRVRADALLRAGETAAREFQVPPGAVHAATQRLLQGEDVARWLDPSGVAWAANEVELVHDGQVLRLDRLVARDTAAGREWWVLDYKLAHRPQEEPALREQMARYLAAVRAIQPGQPVRGAFISGAGQWLPVEAAAPDAGQA